MKLQVRKEVMRKKRKKEKEKETKTNKENINDSQTTLLIIYFHYRKQDYINIIIVTARSYLNIFFCLPPLLQQRSSRFVSFLTQRKRQKHRDLALAS
jgi:hypothetical protein